MPPADDRFEVESVLGITLNGKPLQEIPIRLQGRLLQNVPPAEFKAPDRELPPPQRRVILRAALNIHNSYGQLGMEIARGLITAGVDCAILPINVTEDFGSIPKDIQELVLKEPPAEPWEIMVFLPAHQVMGANVVWLTMWESTRLPLRFTEELSKAAAIIVPSEYNALTFSAAGVQVPRGIHVCNLGVNRKFYFPKGKFPESIKFGTAARLAHGGKRKGVREVIEAFKLAFPEDSTVKLSIKIFPDDEFPHETDPRIEIIREFFDDRKMADWLRSLTCYVSGAYGEGFGKVPVEAMAVGRPVIGCVWSGQAEYLREATGYPVKYHLEEAAWETMYRDCGIWARPDVPDLAQKIQQVASHRPLAEEKGKYAALVASERLTNENFIERLKENLVEIGMISSKVPRPALKKQAKLLVMGPQAQNCGVTQYGRQLALALGVDYASYSPDSEAEVVLFQYHNHYFETEQQFKLLERFHKRGSIIIPDYHEPHPHLQEIYPFLSGAIVHNTVNERYVRRHLKHVLNIPLLGPLMPAGGKSVGKLSNKFIVGWHGFWANHKGVECLIQALAISRRHKFDVGLIAVGGIHNINQDVFKRSKEYWEDCLNLVKSLGLADSVFMCSDTLSYADLKATLEQCHAFVLPYFESGVGQSSAAVALSQFGKPLVFSDVPMFAEWQGEAILTANPTPARLAEQIDALAGSYPDGNHYLHWAQGCARGRDRRSRELLTKAYKDFLRKVARCEFSS